MGEDVNMTEKKCPCENTFGGKGGFEGLYKKVSKEKTMKPFPTYEDAENEQKKVPRAWNNK
jgi:hypothetical protein